MLINFRDWLQRTLPPSAFHWVRYCWWLGRVCWARLAALVGVRRTPIIINGSQASTSLSHRLLGINVLALTQMCRVMAKHGSDKGQGWRGAAGPTLKHNYTSIYSVLFGPLRARRLRVLELGIGTNNENLISNMGPDGKPGASLRGWRELFPNALVFGADIDRDILFEEDRIKTFYCDQRDDIAVRNLWAQPDLREDMDVIIDDGLHIFEANVSFLDISLPHLHQGGIYVVEDINRDAVAAWRDRLEHFYIARFPDCEFALINVPNPFNDYDNNLLIIRRAT